MRKDFVVDPAVKEVIETNKNKNRIIQQDTKIENSLDKATIESKTDNVRSSMDIIHTKTEEAQAINEQLKNDSLSDVEKAVLQNQVDNAHNSINNETTKVNDAFFPRGSIIDIVKGQASGSATGSDSGTTSSFSLETIQDYYSRIQTAMDQLSLEQKGALVNIFSTVIVFFCVSTLIGMFAGDRLIEYLKLEQRFPRLERYFTLRRKFRWYYFI